MAIKTPTITKEQAKEELLRIVSILGKIPTRNQFYQNVELTGCHKNAIEILFGINPYASLGKILWSKNKYNAQRTNTRS